MPLENYSYICRNQLKMLYSQLSTTAPTGTWPSADRDDSLALREVLSSLEARGLIGDLHSTRCPYLQATLSSRFSYYGWTKGQSVMWIADWVSGDTHYRIALGGPANDSVGTVSPITAASSSATPAIQLVLEHAFSPVPEDVMAAARVARTTRLFENEAAAVALLQSLEYGVQPSSRPSTLDQNIFTRGLALASEGMKSTKRPIQKIDTIFRVMGRWVADHVNERKPLRAFTEHDWFRLLPGAEKMDLILGIPLYVGFADDRFPDT